ncbi:thiamine-phosphate diphosphorylase [Aeromicrobium sp. PE09-221]|uniref:thiamine phosphate synthase n=1 Tax=Aeromicrobium sp. PE09-221 TaxID=1898043 RepID=UPI000B6A1922|nr:thiamine phosphate synthase [Aeromicrobium sp. PE09-221]OUZ11350.1 thiamine-phosphate diphosphorylase [Aeromicrobium sp. PE09-221]
MNFIHGVYLVTEPHDEIVDICVTAAQGGLDLIQVRDKRASTSRLVEAAGAIRSATGVPVIVNDDLEAAARVDGVHVGVSDARPADARDALGGEAIIGWSVNGIAQLDDVEQVRACDYLAVSPVWATPTKPDHEEPLGLEGVRMISARSSLPVVAIGGIDLERAAEAVAAGADAVAVVSAITRASDPCAAARALGAAVEEGRAR